MDVLRARWGRIYYSYTWMLCSYTEKTLPLSIWPYIFFGFFPLVFISPRKNMYKWIEFIYEILNGIITGGFWGSTCRRFDALGPGAPQPTNRHA